MTELEFKKLAGDLELSQNERELLESKWKTLKNLMENNLSKNVSLAAIRMGGSYEKQTILPGRKELDIVIVISPKNQIFYTILSRVNMNEIENCIVYNLNDSLYTSTEEKGKNFRRNYKRNTLKFIFEDNVSVDFLVKFRREDLYAIERDNNVENFYLEKDSIQLKFFNQAQIEYGLFKNTIKIVKYFRYDNKLKIKSYAFEILLYFALENYLEENSYIGYLSAFCKGIQTFLNNVTIEISDEMYDYLGVEGEVNCNDNYKIIDAANKSNNIVSDTNNDTINDFKKLLKIIKSNIT